jgi:hypothetical protein
MELYMASSNFIVDEAELEKKVAELFAEDYFTRRGMAGDDAVNIWETSGGPPLTVRQMMSELTRSESRLYDSVTSEGDRTVKRQRIVSETLTGGKMSDT